MQIIRRNCPLCGKFVRYLTMGFAGKDVIVGTACVCGTSSYFRIPVVRRLGSLHDARFGGE